MKADADGRKYVNVDVDQSLFDELSKFKDTARRNSGQTSIKDAAASPSDVSTDSIPQEGGNIKGQFSLETGEI